MSTEQEQVTLDVKEKTKIFLGIAVVVGTVVGVVALLRHNTYARVNEAYLNGYNKGVIDGDGDATYRIANDLAQDEMYAAMTTEDYEGYRDQLMERIHGGESNYKMWVNHSDIPTSSQTVNFDIPGIPPIIQ